MQKVVLQLFYLSHLEGTPPIKSFFGGVGRVSKERNNCCDFTVSSLNHITTTIIPHFLPTPKGGALKYPFVNSEKSRLPLV